MIVSENLLRNTKTPLRGEMQEKKFGSDAKLFPARMADNSRRLNMWRENLPIAKPFAILEHLHGPSTTYELLAASVVILLEIGAVASLLRAVAYNKRVWPELFQQWRSCVMCLRCGQVFRP